MTTSSPTFRSAVKWAIFWVITAIIFNLLIAWQLNLDLALKFLAGYLVEMSLSVDNLFVFMMIFAFFKLTGSQERKALFWGLLGAIILRGLFIFAGISLIQHFQWVAELLGGVLVFTALKTLLQKKESMHLDQHPFIQRLSPYLSPFLLAVLIIEFSDLIFAIDSIPAVLGITTNPFIVVTSNIFAILGLRSLFFVLRHFLKELKYLHIGLAFILGFVGLKMIGAYWIHLSTGLSLGVIVGILTGTIAVSVINK